MSALPRLRLGIMAASVSCLIAGYVVAQQETVRELDAASDQPAIQTESQNERSATQTQRREYTANARGNQAVSATQDQEIQRFLTGCLIAKNQAEVELGQFAQQQAESPQVKEFAQMMVQDHGKLIQKLRKLSGTQASTSRQDQPAQPTQPATTREANGQSVSALTATERSTNSSSPVDRLLAIDRQIVERFTQATRDELQQKQGAEFDKCYMGSQIGGHMHMLAALQVIQQQGPESLQQLAQQAQPEVQKHLDDAKQILMQLEGKEPAGSRAARQPTQPQR